MAPAPASILRLAGDAAIGARASQQDSFALSGARLDDGRSARLFVVADGMGGHAGGAVASMLAVERFLGIAEAGHWASYAETLRQALLAANRAIAERVEREPGLDGMGCTLLAGVIDGQTLWYVSVGDSVLLRVAGTTIERLNADHSMAPLIDSLAARSPDVDQSEHDMQRHMLRSAVTGRPIALMDEGTVALAPGDRLIAASDGLLTLDPPAVAAIVAATPGDDPALVARALVARTIERAMPDQDNVTVVVALLGPAAVQRRAWWRWAAGLPLLAIGGAALFYAWNVVRAPTPAAPPKALRTDSMPVPAASGNPRRAGFPRPAAVLAPTPPAAPPAAAPVAAKRRPALTLDLGTGSAEKTTGDQAAATPPAPTPAVKPAPLVAPPLRDRRAGQPEPPR